VRFQFGFCRYEPRAGARGTGTLTHQFLQHLPLLVFALRFGLPALPSAAQFAGSGNAAAFATLAKKRVRVKYSYASIA
jgi:hypothetical protein